MKDDKLDKDVTELPGIGKINGEKLRKLGCTKVRDVVIKFQALGESEHNFSEWLDLCEITNSEHKRDVYRCIKEIADSK